jgi:hypothetical protein
MPLHKYTNKCLLSGLLTRLKLLLINIRDNCMSKVSKILDKYMRTFMVKMSPGTKFATLTGPEATKMRCLNDYPAKSMIRSNLILSLLAAVLLLGPGLLPARAAPAASPALVRIELKSQADLEKLSGLQLHVYTQLFLSPSDSTLLLPADSNLQTELVRLGFQPRVLDPNTQGASYYLLSGSSEALQRATLRVRVLQNFGKLLLARLSHAQAENLLAIGVRLRWLDLHPLVVKPASQVYTLQAAGAPDPLIQEMINQVSANSLRQTVGDLSGEWSATIDGAPYTLTTRYTPAETPIKKATKYAYDHFQALGLTTTYDYYTLYSSQKRNVIAEQTGLAQPGRIFLLTAHLDSFAYGDPSSLAPGADDNASGAAAVMAAADILSQYSFGCSLRYALFTGEEQGFFGSAAYASDVASQGVEAVLNLDMIAYNSANTPRTLELHTRPSNTSDLYIANLFSNSVSTYQLNLTPHILQDGEQFSDHASFWSQGIPAALAIEDWTDHTPSYHTIGDKLSTLDLSYFTQFTRAAIATVAQLGCLQEGFLLGSVRDSATSAPISGATVQAASEGGKVRSTTTRQDGTYRLALPPGSYTVTASAPAYPPNPSQSAQVVNGQQTSLDFFLQSCPPLSGLDFSFSPWSPAVHQGVSFNGKAAAGSLPITYVWSFGDGGSGEGLAASHAFQARGSYPVSLTASNACAVPLTVTRMVYVETGLFFLPFIPTTP